MFRSVFRVIIWPPNTQKQSFADLQNRCSQKNSQYSHLCWSLFLIKLQAWRPVTLLTFIKKRLQHRCFSVYVTKFLRPSIFIEHFRWLLLNTQAFCFIFPHFAQEFHILLHCERNWSFAAFLEHFKAAALRGSHGQIYQYLGDSHKHYISLTVEGYVEEVPPRELVYALGQLL